MTQVFATSASPPDAARQYDEIFRVVQLFLDGEAKGDAAKLREAAHPDTRMFGSVGGARYDMPIAEFIDLAVKESPATREITVRASFPCSRQETPPWP